MAELPVHRALRPRPGGRGLARSVRPASARGAGVGGAAPPSPRARGRLPDLPRRSRRPVRRSASRASSSTSRAPSATTRASASSSTGTSGRSRRSSRPSTTHHATQIFHPVWLVDEEGAPDLHADHPAEDARTGRWRINPRLSSTGIDPEYAQQQLVDYTRKLEESGKYTLTIWPYHAMLGGVGHALVSSVEEAFFATRSPAQQPSFQVKGDNPLTEHYLDVRPRSPPARTARRSPG